MRRVGVARTTAGVGQGGGGVAVAGFLHLDSPVLRASARRLSGSSSIARGLALGVIGLLFWVLLFGVLYRVLVHFRGADGIGEVLSAKLLGLILLAFLAILF